MPETPHMRWSSALSMRRDAAEAVAECAQAIQTALPGGPVDALFVFVSPHHAAAYAGIASDLRGALKPRHVLGCSAGGVIGAGHEVEAAPGLSVTAAHLPGVTVKPFLFQDAALPDLDGGPGQWEEATGVKASGHPHFVVLADPFTIRAEEMLNGLDFAFPKSSKVGGLASGARGPGGNALFLDDAVHREGAVGLAFMGDVRIDTLVAQGCRPIGKPLRITECRHNLLVTLGGRKPLDILSDLFETSGEKDRRLMRTSLFLGVVMDAFKEGPPKPGDFLIRNLMGKDPETDGLAIGAMLHQGQTVQFHVRDAEAAREDLTAVLGRYTAEHAKEGTAGALLFSCLGRGKHMYGKADHDTGLFRERVGDVPLGGFFCNGEVGPVGDATYIHGFTSCFGLFRPAETG